MIFFSGAYRSGGSAGVEFRVEVGIVTDADEAPEPDAAPPCRPAAKAIAVPVNNTAHTINHFFITIPPEIYFTDIHPYIAKAYEFFKHRRSFENSSDSKVKNPANLCFYTAVLG
jgi:hypothetical protein